MIHWTAEGHPPKLGLNWRVSKGDFVVQWFWVNYPKHEAFRAYFRLRWRYSWYYNWEVERWNIVENWIRWFGLVVVPKEAAEDYGIPKDLWGYKDERSW